MFAHIALIYFYCFFDIVNATTYFMDIGLTKTNLHGYVSSSQNSQLLIEYYFDFVVQ